MALKVVIAVIAIILVLEGALALFNTKAVISLTKKLIRNKDLLRTLGFLELLVGLALLFFSLNT